MQVHHVFGNDELLGAFTGPAGDDDHRSLAVLSDADQERVFGEAVAAEGLGDLLVEEPPGDRQTFSTSRPSAAAWLDASSIASFWRW